MEGFYCTWLQSQFHPHSVGSKTFVYIIHLLERFLNSNTVSPNLGQNIETPLLKEITIQRTVYLEDNLSKFLREEIRFPNYPILLNCQNSHRNHMYNKKSVLIFQPKISELQISSEDILNHPFIFSEQFCYSSAYRESLIRFTLSLSTNISFTLAWGRETFE